MEALSVVSQETMGTFLKILNGKEVHSTLALKDFSDSVMSEVSRFNPKFVSALTTTLTELYTPSEVSTTGMERHKIAAATEGMALILAAYNLETGQRLFPDLSKLTEADLNNRVIPNLVKNMVPPTTRHLFKRNREPNGIPTQQRAINEFIRKACNSAITYPGIFEKGAITMFNILGDL